VLIDGEKSVADSWTIANYLEDNLSGPAVAVRRRGRARLEPDDELVGRRHGSRGMFPLIVADIPTHLKPVDAEYFRRTREARFGKSLEEVVAGATKPSRVFAKASSRCG